MRIEGFQRSGAGLDPAQRPADLLDTGWHDQPLGAARLFAIARRQTWLMLLVMLLAALAGVAYMVLAEPLYTASSTIYAELDSADGAPADPLVQLDTHVEMIRSDRTTEAVIDDLGLEGLFTSAPSRLRRAVTEARAWLDLDPSDAPPETADPLTEAIRGVESGLYVERVGNTAIIGISYTSTSKPLAVDIADAYAAAYIAAVADRAAQSAKRRLRQLQERADAIGKQASAAEAAVQQLRFQSKVVVADAADLQRRTAELTDSLSAAGAEAAAIGAKLALTAAPADLRDLPTAALQTDAAAALYRSFVDASARLDQLRAQPAAAAPGTAQLEASLAEMRAALMDELRRASDALELSLAETSGRQSSLQREIDTLAAYGRSPEWSALLDAERKAAIYRDMYNNTLNDLENSTGQVPRRSDVRLISEALPPLGPSSPRLKVVLALAITVGAILGSALAVYREWNRSLRPGGFR